MTDKISKFIKSLDQKTRGRLKEKLILLKEGKLTLSKLQGNKNLYRLRVGKIRIIYNKTTQEIIDIDYRGNIY